MIQPILGIDIVKATFDVTLIVGEKRWHEHFENKADGYKKLSRWIEKRTAEKTHACMEATGQYGNNLAEYLYEAGHKISVVNPARIKAYANSRLRRNKTDKADAELIAEYCLRENPTLWSPPPASFTELQALVRYLEAVQDNCQQEKNRLQSGCSNATVIEYLVDHIRYLEEKIKQIKQDIQKHIEAHPELKRRQKLLASIPGIGDLTAAKVLGEVRDICEFEDARQLAAYAGLTPRNFVSGTSVHKKSRLSKMGNSNLRKALYMPAVVAQRYNPIIRSFCQRLLVNGLRPMEIIGAAMHKLLRLMYGILKSGKPFDPNFFNEQAIVS